VRPERTAWVDQEHFDICTASAIGQQPGTERRHTPTVVSAGRRTNVTGYAG
jgi:hypothetical protein